METIKVGIREFLAYLSECIASRALVAVARHSLVIGHFIITQGQVDAIIVSLNKASKLQIRGLPHTILIFLQLYLTSKLLASHQAPSKSLEPVWNEDVGFFGAGVPTWTTDRAHLYFVA